MQFDVNFDRGFSQQRVELIILSIYKKIIIVNKIKMKHIINKNYRRIENNTSRLFLNHTNVENIFSKEN